MREVDPLHLAKRGYLKKSFSKTVIIRLIYLFYGWIDKLLFECILYLLCLIYLVCISKQNTIKLYFIN